MSHQLELYPDDRYDHRRKAMSHRDDPETSKEAAAKHVMSGKRDTHAWIVFNLIKAHPRRTSGELAKLGPLGLTETRRRITDLKRDGAIRSVGSRPCAELGSTMLIWEVVDG